MPNKNLGKCYVCSNYSCILTDECRIGNLRKKDFPEEIYLKASNPDEIDATWNISNGGTGTKVKYIREDLIKNGNS